MIAWGLLLHFYQPPHQLPAILRRVVEESYLPLIEVFRAHPHARATVNISGVLSEMLWDSGYREVIRGLRELAERGQFEFTGTGKYHPILPLISEQERVRQIRRNVVANQFFFGHAFQPKGFFPPEMAYNYDIVKSIVESRHDWMLLSGIACPAMWTTDVVYEVPWEDQMLGVLFRDDILSNKISFQNIDARGFIEDVRQMVGPTQDGYVITAMDAETFGHHIPHYEESFLSAAFGLIKGDATGVAEPALAGIAGGAIGDDLPSTRSQRGAARRKLGATSVAPVPVQSLTLSQIVETFPRGHAVHPKASSWSTNAEDLVHGNVFPLWDDPGNPLHRLLWKHLRLANEMVAGAEATATNESSKNFADISRAMLDQAQHSCQFWWASRRPMWDVNMVHRGLMEQEEAVMNACRSVRLSDCPEHIKDEYFYKFAAARDLGGRIIDLLINM